MSVQNVAGVEALYLKADTPRAGGAWRQWSFLLNGHAFLIVSALPKQNWRRRWKRWSRRSS